MNSKSAASSVTKVVTDAARNLVLLVVVLGALLAWGGREVTLSGTPDPTQDRTVAMAGWAQESIDQQVAALGCDKAQRLADEVAVRNAAKDKAGRIQFDTVVVRKVSLEQGLALAAEGKVWTVGWCG